jgi:large subunit ribosomal protein L21
MAVKKTTKKATLKVSKDKGPFAVIMTGGKQYKVHAGETLKIEKLAGEPKVGDTIKFDKVLLTDDGATTKVGAPQVSGVIVEAKLLEIGKAKKVEVMKYLQKSRYLKTRGHRQPFMRVEITSIK